MKNIRYYIKAFLTFAKWEQRGIFLLVILIIALMVFNLTYKPKSRVVERKDISGKIAEYEAKVEASKKILEERKSRNYSYQNRNRYYAENKRSDDAKDRFPKELFVFDPNKVSKDSLMKLGFSAKQSDVIVRYRSRGGVFRTPDEFGKLYVVDPEMLEILRSYIRITEIGKTQHAKTQIAKPVDLNIADTSDLVALKGIGSTLAKKIVSYRERLGGYVRYDQLLEITGITEDRFPEIEKQLAPLSTHKRIKINSATVEEMKRHPYITEYESRNIVYYRMKKGVIESPEQLLTLKLVDKKRFEKLKDYIDCTK